MLDHRGAVSSPSPNFGSRKNGALVDCLILHYTGMADDEAALSWLQNPKSGVSSHYFVHQNGEIHQLVRERDRAWHAGASFWKGERDINSCSIGIEIANPGHEHCNHNSPYQTFASQQIDALTALCMGILSRHAIPAARVLAHSDIAPDRKEDPGELFPWERLAENGIGNWLDPVSGEDQIEPSLVQGVGPVSRMQAMLSEFGYNLSVSGINSDETKLAIKAFQRHYRQNLCNGILDISTVKTLSNLLK